MKPLLRILMIASILILVGVLLHFDAPTTQNIALQEVKSATGEYANTACKYQFTAPHNYSIIVDSSDPCSLTLNSLTSGFFPTITFSQKQITPDNSLTTTVNKLLMQESVTRITNPTTGLATNSVVVQVQTVKSREIRTYILFNGGLMVIAMKQSLELKDFSQTDKGLYDMMVRSFTPILGAL